MAHLLIKGKDQMFSGKGILPWHFAETGPDGRTIVIPTNVTLAEGLRVVGLDKETVISKRITMLTFEDGTTLAPPTLWDNENESESTAYSVIRNGEAIAFASERYRPLSTLDLLKPAEPFLGFGACMTTAGTLRGGRQVFAVFELPEAAAKHAGDDYRRYLVFFTSHDGSMAAQYLYSNVRVVCANTMRLALYQGGQSAYKIKHTENAEARVKDAMRAMEVGRKFYAAQDAEIERLLAATFTNAQWDALVKHIVPVRTDENGESTQRGISRAENRREELNTALRANDLDNIRGTAWGALQAVTDWDQHNRTYRVTHKTTAGEAYLLRSLSDKSLTAKALEFIRDTVAA
jgi:phage/plasmid-like protein (TIGR03299 family)